MSEHKYKFTKSGLKSWAWNGERKRACRFKKQDGKYVAYDKTTEEIVAIGDTLEAVENTFWEEDKELTYVFAILREPITFEPGVTTKDFFNWIEKDENENLKALCEFLFGKDYFEDIDQPPNALFQKWGRIQNGVLHFFYGFFADCNGLAIDQIMPIYDGENIIVEGTLYFTLLDILLCLHHYGTDQRETLYFKPEGLTFATGEVVDFPIAMLFNPVEVLDGTTLLNIFDYVQKNDALREFIAPYSWCSAIEEFHEEARHIHEPGEDDANLFYSYVSRSLPRSQYKKEPAYWSDGMDYYLMGEVSEQTKEWYIENGKEPPTEERYGCGFGGASSYANLPIKLINDYEVHDESKIVKGKLQEGEIWAKVKSPTTLIEFLDAIYDEISFYGPPEKRNLMGAELKERVDDIKEAHDNGEKIDGITIDPEKGTSADGKTFGSVSEMMRDMFSDVYSAELLEELDKEVEEDS